MSFTLQWRSRRLDLGLFHFLIACNLLALGKSQSRHRQYPSDCEDCHTQKCRSVLVLDVGGSTARTGLRSDSLRLSPIELPFDLSKDTAAGKLSPELMLPTADASADQWVRSPVLC